MHHHPQQGESRANHVLPLVTGGAHVEHDVAYQVVVEGECCLMRQLWDKSDQVSDYLKHFLLTISGQLLHEIFEKQVAVLTQEIPDDLMSHLVDSDTIRVDSMVIQQLDYVCKGSTDGGGQKSLCYTGGGSVGTRHPLLLRVRILAVSRIRYCGLV